ncbi:MAG: hypothetical protein PHF67_03085 [Candidatus Nanoarchaeia archaeon]|nr:hypothetical protein [Candidatus Nanoarchaeia archaeon]
MLEILQYLSIALEIVIAVIGLLIFFQKKKEIGIYIFITFAIYVFYDFTKQFSIVNNDILYVLFFIATISIFYGILKLLKEKKQNFKNKKNKNRR